MTFMDSCEATAAGELLLHDPNADNLLTVVDAFYEASDKAPESAVFDTVHALGGNYVAGGRFSHVMRLGEYAIKVSTPTSTASEDRPEHGPYAESTVTQMRFLNSLRAHLDTMPEAGITTPTQYFAVRGAHGGRLAVQQFMDGWISLGRWAERTLRFGEHDAAIAGALALSSTVRDRIERAVAGTTLRTGLNDLRLDQELLHPGNLLVPRRAPYDAATVPLCIIDQPKTFSRPEAHSH